MSSSRSPGKREFAEHSLLNEAGAKITDKSSGSGLNVGGIAAAIKAIWSRFRLWRRQRPFAGAILMILAGLLVLWGPVSLMRFALFPGNLIWAGLLVGALLVTMGLIQLFAPSYALITGAIGIVLSLISLIVALGGFGLGMILGLIGGALGVAWKPKGRRLSKNRSANTRTRQWPRWQKRTRPGKAVN
ncbi:MAG TPA: DUF6114 domain-containing protein [Ktedonobacteraceae bacterium]|nr:DUF6114 domain-containing protein [Ktedonobacteraceae bacterium]